MGILDLVSNTIEGSLQAGIGAAKVVFSPVTQLTDLDGRSHLEDGADTMAQGLQKIGSTETIADSETKT